MIDPPPSRKTARALTIQLFAVFGAPAAWALQLVTNYSIAAEACFPNDMPLARPDANMAWDRSALVALNLLALGLGAIATLVAWGLFRSHRRTSAASNDSLRVGIQRRQFMAICGLLNGFGFMAATLFNTVVAVGVPQCSG